MLRAEKIMNWKIKEFTSRAKSLKKELASLVKSGGMSTSALPRALAFNLRSHSNHSPADAAAAGSTRHLILRLMQLDIGYIYRNCTEHGWAEPYPSYDKACEFTEYEETDPETTYFSNFKQVYTAGYATSLISLISAIFVFTVFRKFHCTRNYIHINLFFSFILRASAVFIKDGVLFSDVDLDHCFMSTHSGCNSCWDDTDVAIIWWIIKAPITASLLVNFIIFINVIRILVQKLRSPGVGGNDTKNTGAEARIFIELGLGSFQGFVVALLYCFLNGEVQAELKKRFWKWQTQSYLRYSKRRRTLFTESSTVTQISVLDKSSPKDQPTSETHALTASNVSIV
ncbi:hypothetical protein FQN60_012717 [Etheostoma spectabile]|uniref:G-protein coupled receptors family 2 profile 2 domain-containing protein n=1 Tax=Etheostoma spectabile TaxID=54343 RepID=A0A5J5D3Q4_9PERO|nr:hypothetical protein FQN60_012717 [Etheostoma spectabile]